MRQHLVLWTPYRTGSHMLRSMLRHDPRVADANQFMDRPGGNFGFWLDDFARHHEGRLVVSNPKVNFSRDPRLLIPAMIERDVGVIHVVRRNPIAQQASLELAFTTKEWHQPAPDQTIRMGWRFQQQVFRTCLAIEWVRLLLVEHDIAHVEMFYEEIVKDADAGDASALRAAVEAVTGWDVDVGLPTTPKVARRPVHEYVEDFWDPVYKTRQR